MDCQVGKKKHILLLNSDIGSQKESFSKRRVFMTYRALLVAMAVCGLVFYGCAKKPKQVQQVNAGAPTIPEPAAAPATPKTDTGEVFNQYYKDSKGKKVDKTFSMNAEGNAESYTPSFSENGRYVVQIAAGPSSSGAEELANAFRGKGYPAYVAEVQNPTPELSGTYYRVRIGGFNILADAKAFGENILKQANYDYWVDLKSNDGVGTGSGGGAAAEYSSGASSSTYTPSYTPTTTAEPSYTPSTPATTTDYGASSSSSSSTTTSTGTSTYDWSATPSTTTPSTESSTTTTPSTGSSWTTETPSTIPPETTPAPATDTSAGTGSWGGGSWK
jgi:hypothetical protein